MEANKRRFSELVGGSVQFVIPAFQRDYNWEEEQCQRLWDDIERVGRKRNGDHFFGPIVYIATTGHGAAFTRWLLIDGQQRMTTVSLLMAAVREHIREPSPQPSGRAAKIEHDFLLNTYEEEGQRRKLVLRDRDDETLSWLVGGGEEPKPEMNGVKKSDGAILPSKRANKGVQIPAESVEGRASTKGNPRSESTRRTQRRESVSQAAGRIRQAFAVKYPR